MKKHLALFAALFAIVLMTSSAIAQDSTPAATATTPATTTKAAKKGKSSGGGASGRADAELADLTKSLTLTDDQQAKIKPIFTDESAKIHAAKKGSTGSADDSKAKNKVIRDDANKQIRALLTPDQQKIFDASSKKEGGKKSEPAAAPAPAPAT
jgi:Spy/CpxP family protein refolding chaperone